MASIDDQSVIQAIRARSSTLKKQIDSLTFEGVRRLLEKEIGLETFALDGHKHLIKKLLEETLFTSEDDDVCEKLSEDGMKAEEFENGSEVLKSSEQNQADESQLGPASSNSMEEHGTDDANTVEKGKQKSDKLGRDCLETSLDSLGAHGKISDSIIKDALWKRASYLKANIESLSLSSLRRLIEEDLHLEKKTLDAHKNFISELVDEILDASIEIPKEENSTKTEDNKLQGKTNVSKKKKRDVASETSEMSNPDKGNNNGNTMKSTSKMKKRRRQEPDEKNLDLKKQRNTKNKEGTKSANKQRKEKIPEYEDAPSREAVSEDENAEDAASQEVGSEEEDDVLDKHLVSGDSERDSPVCKKKEEKVPNTPVVYGKKVEHLKKIIKACGMGIPPAIYKKAKQLPESKREKHIIEELTEILRKAGLSSNPSEKEIKAVKKRREKEKDLEGIDTTNIISEGRPRRAASSFFSMPPTTVKKPLDEENKDSEDDEEDEESEDDESSESSDNEEQDLDEDSE